MRRGVPFRAAHGVVAKVAAEARKRGLGLREVAELPDWTLPPPLTAEDLRHLSAEAAVERRSATGGTARAAVLEQIRQGREP